MESKTIALTELVKKLGYEDHSALANKIRDILKEKEQFSRFIVKENDQNRDEKTLVKVEAEILVDNIAILSAFPVFGRSPKEKNEYPPLSKLLSLSKRDEILKRFSGLKSRLQKNIERTNESIASLPVFKSALEERTVIDIEKDSLRALMNNANKTASQLDLSKSHKVGIWNEIVLLHEEVDTNSNSPELHLKLGYKLKEIGEIEQAIEALENSIAIEPHCVGAHALLALIYSEVFNKVAKESYTVNATTDFSGEISHPMNSEEFHINERMQSLSQQLGDVNTLFIENAIKGLIFWPTWSHDETHYKHELSTGLDFHTPIKLERKHLFLKLLTKLNHIDARNYQSSLNCIIESFKLYPEDSDTFLNCLPTHGEPFFEITHILRLYDWLSHPNLPKAVDSVIEFYLPLQHLSTSEKLLFLQSSFIGELIINHYGKEIYLDLLKKYKKENFRKIETEQLKAICLIELRKLNKSLNGLKKKFSADYRCNGDFVPTIYQDDIALPEDSISKIFESATNDINGWQKYLDHEGWSYQPYANNISFVCIQFFFMASLCEIQQFKRIEQNTDFLVELTENHDCLMSAIRSIELDFLHGLFNRIELSEEHSSTRNKLYQALEIIYECKEDMEEQLMIEEFG